MALKFNINRGFENRETSSFLKIIVGSVILAVICLLVYLSLNGKHNKLPGGIETNIPVYKQDTMRIKKDTIVVNNNQKNYNIDNKGIINIDSK